MKLGGERLNSDGSHSVGILTESVLGPSPEYKKQVFEEFAKSALPGYIGDIISVNDELVVKPEAVEERFIDENSSIY
jgi:hypothetical protein